MRPAAWSMSCLSLPVPCASESSSDQKKKQKHPLAARSELACTLCSRRQQPSVPRPCGGRSELACTLCSRRQRVSKGACGAAEHVTVPQLPGQQVAAGQSQPTLASILCSRGQQSAGDSDGQHPANNLSGPQGTDRAMEFVAEKSVRVCAHTGRQVSGASSPAGLLAFHLMSARGALRTGLGPPEPCCMGSLQHVSQRWGR